MNLSKIFLGTLILLSLAASSFAQSISPLYDYLEEKVRDTTIRNFLIKQYEGNVTTADVAEVEAYYRAKSQYSGRSEELLEDGAEPHIAIHPTDPNILALSFMQESGVGIAYPVFISTDAGATWNKSSFDSEAALNQAFPGDFQLGGGDPILAFDEDGTLYLSYIYVHGFTVANNIADMLFVYSEDTGQSFIIPPLNDHVIYGNDLFTFDILDRQWMIVDNSGGPNDGNLYLSAFYPASVLTTSGQVVLAKPANASRFDLANVATAIPFGPNGETTQFGNVQMGPNGRLHLSCAYLDDSTNGGLIYHTVSTDGGQTFNSPVQVGTGELLDPNQTFIDVIVHNRENSAPSMAVDGDNVYIVWTDLADSASQAYFSYSNDGGQSFSPQFEFGNALVDSVDVFHFFPTVAADNGRVAISWYTVNKTSGETNYYLTESIDSGVTFDTVLVIADATSNFDGFNFYGDYNSSIKSDCSTYSVWSDGRSGSPDVYVAKTQTCQGPVASISELSPVSEALQVSNIWPNPASDQVYLSVSIQESESISIDVYDLQGRLIERNLEETLSPGDHNLKLDIAGLSTGQYLLRIQASNGLFASRVLVVE